MRAALVVLALSVAALACERDGSTADHAAGGEAGGRWELTPPEVAADVLDSRQFARELDYPAWLRLMSMVEPARLGARGLPPPAAECAVSEISIWFVGRAAHWTAVGPAHIGLCGPGPLAVGEAHLEAVRRTLARQYAEDPGDLARLCWVGRTVEPGPGGEELWMAVRGRLLDGLSAELAEVEPGLQAVDFHCDFATAESRVP